MPFNPLISIIVPVYNGANYVGEAIESILSQSYKNFEIIVVNDGSKDDGATRKAVEPYFDNVKYLEQENGGVASALNTGIKNMKGEYFAWLSHDDIFLPHKLESQIKILEDLSDRKILLYSDYGIINSEKEDMYDVVLDAYMLNNSSNHMPVLRGCLNGCTMLIHRDIFETCGTFDTSLRFTQDYELWDRICWKYPMIHQANITVKQRLHDAQDSHKPDALIECNTLWINIMKSRDEAIQIGISGSSKNFLEGMQTFLSHTPYLTAQDFVKQKILKLTPSIPQKDFADKRVPTEVENSVFNEETSATVERPSIKDFSNLTIIINCETTYCEGLKSINSLAAINSPDFEIIVILDDKKSTSRLAKKFSKISKCIRFIDGGENLSLARQAAIDIAQYKYVMFLTTNDVVIKTILSAQLINMKDTGCIVSYAPYISICTEISDRGIIVASHWLGEVTMDDIITRCAINISTMIFEKKIFSKGILPPLKEIFSEVKFLTSLREHFIIKAFPSIAVISHVSYQSYPLNLTKSLDGISALIKTFNEDYKFANFSQARKALEHRYSELFAVRLQNENAGKSLLINTPVELAYKSEPALHNLIDNMGLFNIDILMEMS